ncbi:MAG: energy transducer TonB [Proteobacteria bacterium]|nr:energy transducer TonB [Pseudomonadota bacterium]
MLTLTALLVLPALAAPETPPETPAAEAVETGLPPALIERTWPEFPASARTADPVDHACDVEVLIDPQGATRAVSAIDCPEDLAAPTVEAMQRWRWRPIIVEGRGVDATFRASLHYTAASATPASFPSTTAIDTTWLEVPRCDIDVTLAAGAVARVGGSYIPECAPETDELPTWPSKLPEEPVACNARFLSVSGEITELDLESCPEPVRDAAEATLRSWRWPWWERDTTPYDVTLVFRADELGPAIYRPQAKTRVTPEFPKEAVDAGFVDASCDVTLMVDAEGAVSDVEFRRCHEIFQDAAAAALTQWTFDEGGEVPLRLRFRLDGPAARPSEAAEKEQPVAILDTDVAHCSMEVSVSGLGAIARLAANRVPDCVAKPVGGVDWPSSISNADSCSVAFDVTNGEIGRVTPLDCPGPLRKAAKRTVTRWEYPEKSGVQHFEVRVVYKPEGAP